MAANKTSRPWNIAVASGKGGTGKTTVSVSLALTLARAGLETSYVDCDVEEPNGHLFLKPQIDGHREVTNPVPRVDAGLCTSCGACGEICRYGAIVCVGEKVLTFPELCHACGGCTRVCPQKAISEEPRPLGEVVWGKSGPLHFVHGLLKVGEVGSPSIIRAVKAQSTPGVRIIDAPPGTSCPVVTAAHDADFVLLVTEPTPFGLHDLGLALDLVDVFDRPHGVVINRVRPGDDSGQRFCRERGVPVLAEIPDDRRIAEAYSRGESLVTALPAYEDLFAGLWRTVSDMLTSEEG